MTIEIINPAIFNTQRKYAVTNGSLFLGETVGLLDSVHRSHPEIHRLYKLLKTLDWDENEFQMDSCIAEFKTCPRDLYEIMILTLAWQWEADSVAAHSIVPIVAPFVSNSELWCAWSRVGENENLHGLAYSEVVKGSFEDSTATFLAVLQEVEAYRRLSTVAEVFANTKRVAGLLMLEQIDRNSDEARDAIMKFVVALLLLERVQFMSSFAITFAFANSGMFVPIGKTVQKICNEELNIHVKLDKYVLAHELTTDVGRASYARILPDVKKMFFEVGNSELNWTRDKLFANGRQLPGCNAELICDWVQYGLTDVSVELGLDMSEFGFKRVTVNPLDYMEDWVDINRSQGSPQEEKLGNYLIGGFTDTVSDKVYDVDDL